MSAALSPRSPRPALAYALALVAIHFYFVSYAMSVVQVPLALADEPAWLVGLVVGMLGFAGMLTRPLAGVWVDSGRRQLWVRIGAIATVAAFAGYALDLGPWVTLIFRALHGVGMGFFNTALLAIVGSMLPAHRRGLGMGFFQSSNGAAWLYAAAVAVWLIDGFSFQASFLIAGIASIGALIFGGAAGDPESPERARGGAPAARRRPSEWISRTGLLPGLVFLSLTTPWGALNAFLPLFAEERALGNAGVFWSVYAVAQLGTRVSSGWLSDRFGRASVTIPAILIATLGLVLLFLAQTPTVLVLAAFAYGAGLAATQTSIVALIVDRAPTDRLGSSLAMYTIAWDVGAVIGSIGLGVVAGFTSYAFVFALSAVMPLAGLVLFITRVRDRAASARTRFDTEEQAT